jgi:DNA invertase Pin-like site-specific DNA recombinase
MKIGYARVSSMDQKLELQLAALEKYGCQKIYQKKKRAVKERLELEKMNAHLRKGDTVVVWKLDRLGRSLRHLINLVNDYKEHDIPLVSINDNIDTSTPQGRLIFNLFATFAEFERELVSERTKAGLKAARAKGHFAGRKPGLTTEAKKKAWAALHLSRDSQFSVSEILKQLSISKATYYRYVEWAKQDEAGHKNKGKY